MFPIVPQLIIFMAIATLMAGAVIGLLFGYISAWILGLPITRIWKDATLGAIGTLVGFYAAFTIPFPENTVTKRLGPDVVMTSTMNRFQHPFLAAFILAAILAVLHQVFRFLIAKKGRRLSPNEPA